MGGKQKRPVQAPGGHSRRDVAYIVPPHPTEVDRLDVQHYALRGALGWNYVAPLEQPARILDVGTGTGQWAFDLCAEFASALVVGLDLEPSKPEQPSNYRYVKTNILQGLPLCDDQFDFVHQRLMLSAVPLKAWSELVKDLARVTRPGGWIELVEPAPDIEPASPATGRMFEMAKRLGRSLGLDTTGIVFRSLDDFLHRAGLTDIQRHTRDIPLGDWGGRVGSLLASDMRAGMTRLGGVFQQKFGLSEKECHDLLLAMVVEWEEHRSTWTFAFAFGRKPAPTG